MKLLRYIKIIFIFKTIIALEMVRAVFFLASVSPRRDPTGRGSFLRIMITSLILI